MTDLGGGIVVDRPISRSVNCMFMLFVYVYIELPFPVS